MCKTNIIKKKKTYNDNFGIKDRRRSFNNSSGMNNFIE